MATIFRCPHCGAVTVLDAKHGDRVIAVYDLCGPIGSGLTAGRMPVRMERVLDAEEAPPAQVAAGDGRPQTVLVT